MPPNQTNSRPPKKPTIEIAGDAFSYTNQQITNSSILLSDAELATVKGMEISERINSMRQEPLSGEIYSLTWITEVASAARKYAAGNCCERSCVAFMFLLENIKEPIEIELFNNPFDDHFFVVIGRSTLTNPADPRSWNKDTIICDPMLEDSCYTLADVNFDNLAASKYRIFVRLWSPKDSSISLKKDILAIANGVTTGSRIISQDRLVLRTRANVPLGQLTTHNTAVQMCYEAWDLPKKSDYKKQKQQEKNSARTLTSPISFHGKTQTTAIQTTQDHIPINGF